MIRRADNATENLADMLDMKKLKKNYALILKIITSYQQCLFKVSNDINELEIKQVWFQKKKSL